jgi:RNA recognition motif-containing protein
VKFFLNIKFQPDLTPFSFNLVTLTDNSLYKNILIFLDKTKKENASSALKLDRSLVDTRPVFVSKNKDKSEEIPGAESKLKYATNLEKNKLFVSGLPFSTDKDALEKIMEKFGKLKEVRIVVYKNGKSKGLAYVEFEDDQSAKSALLQTDGMLVGENQISVAISNPPKRNNPAFESNKAEGPNEKARSLGSGSYKTSAAAQGPAPTTSAPSSAFSFVPRSQVIGRKKTLSFK